MAKKRRTYSGFEKQRAMELAGQIGVKAASKRLGIPESTLRSWGAVSPKKPAAVKPASRPQTAHNTSAGHSVSDKKEIPVYLHWYICLPIFVLLAMIGLLGVLVTPVSLLLWPLDIVLIILRIRWSIQRRGQQQKTRSASIAEPVDAESPAPVNPIATPPVVEAPVAAETPIETEETPAPEVEPSVPVEEPAPVEKPVIKKYSSDYHCDDVKLCIIKGQEPDFDSLPIGTELFFWTEPENEHDKNAIKVCATGDVKIGYLYSGKLRDMTSDFVHRDDAVIGQITYNDGQSIKFCMDFVRDDGDDVDF